MPPPPRPPPFELKHIVTSVGISWYLQHEKERMDVNLFWNCSLFSPWIISSHHYAMNDVYWERLGWVFKDVSCLFLILQFSRMSKQECLINLKTLFWLFPYIFIYLLVRHYNMDSNLPGVLMVPYEKYNLISCYLSMFCFLFVFWKNIRYGYLHYF